MKIVSMWWKKSLGKKLYALHAWNAWLVVVLAVSGLLLPLSFVREWGGVRVMLKEGHVWIGLLSTLVVILYLPFLLRHIRQLKGKPTQQWNLGIVLVLLVGWIVTGIILWQFRRLPPIWSNMALGLHDLLTWVGVPYAIYHSITRSQWLRQRRPGAVRLMEEETGTAITLPKSSEDSNIPLVNSVQARVTTGAVVGTVRDVLYTRRSFIRWGLAGVLIIGIGPKFTRWLFSDQGGIDLSTFDHKLDGNRMIPAPQPLPDSIKLIGGGSKGTYRIYSVTPIPAFSSDNWTFTIRGLVDQSQQWDWNQFISLARNVQVSDFHCVTGWSVYNNTWEGIPLTELLAIAGVQTKARYAKFYSGDGVYTSSLSLEQVTAMKDVMVAVLLDGKPIPQDLGGPVRLIVPKMYAYKSVKWLHSIELLEEDHIGYWEERGYPQDAWVGTFMEP